MVLTIMDVHQKITTQIQQVLITDTMLVSIYIILLKQVAFKIGSG